MPNIRNNPYQVYLRSDIPEEKNIIDLFEGHHYRRQVIFRRMLLLGAKQMVNSGEIASDRVAKAVIPSETKVPVVSVIEEQPLNKKARIASIM